MTYLTILLFSILDVELENSVDYIIAQYLLLNEKEIYGISLSKISEDCNVSKASISRFCRRIGCLDYVDLQLLIRNNIYMKQDVLVSKRRDSLLTDGQYMQKCTQICEYLEKIVCSHETSQLLKDIQNYKKIGIFGHLQSGDTAFKLRHDLSRIQKLAYSTTSIVLQEKYISKADNQSLIIIFSASGRYFSRFSRVSAFPMKAKPRVYLITAKRVEKPLEFVDDMIILAEEYDSVFSHVALELYENYLTYRLEHFE